MSSIFKWMEKSWPFSSNSDFVCFAKIESHSCPVVRMEINTSFSAPYHIELLVLTELILDEKYLQAESNIFIDLFPNNANLNKTFSGYLVSFTFQGTCFTLSNSNEGFKTEKNIYSLVLMPYIWNATKKSKITIFHKKKKSTIIESVLKPYKTKAVLTDPTSIVQDVVTQYEESDFFFAVRLMEELGCFCYYDFSSKDPVFKIKRVKEVGSSDLAFHNIFSLKLVDEIHDNFDFNQIINLKISGELAPNVSNPTGDLLALSKIDSLKNVKEEVETNRRYSTFSCECTSFNLFSGDYFSINSENKMANSFLSAPISSYQSFFIEKSRLILDYDEPIGWYIRNHLDGFVIDGGKSEYKLKRKTVSPHVSGSQKAYVCGYIKNSLYINSEGKVRVRLAWIPFKSGDARGKSSALINAKKSREQYLVSAEQVVKLLDSKASNLLVEKTKAGLDKGASLSKEALDKGLKVAEDVSADLLESAASDVSSTIENQNPSEFGTAGIKAAGAGLEVASSAVGSTAGKIMIDVAEDLTKDTIDTYTQKLKDDFAKRAKEDRDFTVVDDFLQDKTAVWSVENSDDRALTGWIPVSQWGCSGDAFGNYSFPRVGQIVTVTFIDGNPDLPIVSSTSFALDTKNEFLGISNDNLNFPYAITSNDKGKHVPHKAGIFQDKLNAIKEVKDTLHSDLKDSIKNPEKLLDQLEGVCVPDLIPAQCRDKGRSKFETENIESSSGNLVIKSYSYDDSMRTNRAGWNEISFFNQRYKEAIRLSSAHYLFLHSRNIMHLIAPKLLKEQLGIRCTTISGNKHEIISGKCNYFFGGDCISFFPGGMARKEVEYDDGMAIERLQLEVATKFMEKVSGFAGKEQMHATFLNKGLYAYISFLGDYVALALGGSFFFTTIAGEFNVNSNAASFNILGLFSITVAGYMTIKAASKFDVNTVGTIKMNSGNSIHLRAVSNIRLFSGKEISLKAGMGIDMSSTKSFGIKTAGKIDLKSSSMDIDTGKLTIKAANLSIAAASLSINVASNVDIKSALFQVKAAQVSLTGALVKLG